MSASTARHETGALLRAHLAAASGYRHLTHHCPICYRLLRLAMEPLTAPQSPHTAQRPRDSPESPHAPEGPAGARDGGAGAPPAPPGATATGEEPREDGSPAAT
ncbi:DUF6274 family protein [Streptomyces sp. NPDC057429]|uniref:DUF6274 family protein n=1 Tax=Streptomyces sp. NPDC057429 TaxID=3346130 RepID=UPI0036A9A2DD